MSTHRSTLRRAAGIAALGAIVATSTVIGGSGVGGVLNLGVNNTISTTGSSLGTTKLSGAVNGNSLSIQNTSTSSVARAIAAISKSATGATARFENTGGAPAVSLVVPAGKAPMAVSAGAGKVTNLNADKVDGLDGAAFARGSGITVLSNRLVVPETNEDVPLLTLPGLGELYVRCPVYYAYAYIYWRNSTTRTIDVWVDTSGSRNASLAGPNAVLLVASDNDAGPQVGRELLVGSDASPKTTASIELGADRAGSSHPCRFQATATIWARP